MSQFTPKTDEEFEEMARHLNAGTQTRLDEEPRVLQASYGEGRLSFVLGGAAASGVIVTVPARSIAALADASPQDIAEMKIVESGHAVHWPLLDVQMTSVALLQIVCGLRSLRAHLAKAGSVRSEAKSAAGRLNGLKGGRPRKTPMAA